VQVTSSLVSLQSNARRSCGLISEAHLNCLCLSISDGVKGAIVTTLLHHEAAYLIPNFSQMKKKLVLLPSLFCFFIIFLFCYFVI
jgi:hypothetical protein